MAKIFTPKLSPRMEMLVSMVPSGAKVADVGCDHGYVSIALLQRNIAVHSIASDIKEGPLEQARKNIEKAQLGAQIETRLRPGISGLKEGEADTILIAGMGFRTIADILLDNIELVNKAKYLIVQPQSEIADMRRLLKLNGFTIIKNCMAREDKKYYFAMIASRTERAYPGEEESFLVNLVKGQPPIPEFRKYMDELDSNFGLDLIYGERQLAHYLLHVEQEWSDAVSKLKSARNQDYNRIMELSVLADMARNAREMNGKFCGVDEDLMAEYGLDAAGGTGESAR